MAQTDSSPSLKQAVTFENQPLLKPVETKPSPPPRPSKSFRPILIAILIIAAGIGSGYFLSQKFGGVTANIKSPQEAATAGLKVGDIVGSADDKAFKDNAIGVLDTGGVDGEGSHRLYREGGDSQTVYLTSSVMDLDQFVGHKIQIWGETFNAQKAGWLMDVGRVKVLQLNAAKPF